MREGERDKVGETEIVKVRETREREKEKGGRRNGEGGIIYRLVGGKSDV